MSDAVAKANTAPYTYSKNKTNTTKMNQVVITSPQTNTVYFFVFAGLSPCLCEVAPKKILFLMIMGHCVLFLEYIS